MKILGILLFLISFNLQAEKLYSSVDDYLKTVTTFSEDQLQYRNEHPEYEYPNRAVSKNKRWYVGYEPNGTSQSAFLYVLEANKQGKLKLVSKINDDREGFIPYVFSELVFDANDKFHVSTPTVPRADVTYTYHFQLVKNKWYLVRDERNELGRCGEGDDAEMPDSLQVSTNYLTGSIEEQRYSEKDCKPLKLAKTKRKFSLVALTDFYPFMEIAPSNKNHFRHSGVGQNLGKYHV